MILISSQHFITGAIGPPNARDRDLSLFWEWRITMECNHRL